VCAPVADKDSTGYRVSASGSDTLFGDAAVAVEHAPLRRWPRPPCEGVKPPRRRESAAPRSWAAHLQARPHAQPPPSCNGAAPATGGTALRAAVRGATSAGRDKQPSDMF
jgi:hypothetical protein